MDYHAEQRFDMRALRGLERWLQSKRFSLDGMVPFLMYTLFTHDTPAPLVSVRVAERIAQLEAALRRSTSSAPSLVTIARSNEGGYTPIEATAELERRLASLTGASKSISTAFSRILLDFFPVFSLAFWPYSLESWRPDGETGRKMAENG